MQRHFSITTGEDTYEFLRLNAARENVPLADYAGGLLADIVARIIAAAKAQAREEADRMRDQ